MSQPVLHTPSLQQPNQITKSQEFDFSLDDRGLRALTAASHLTALTSLRLRFSSFATLAPLAAAAWLPRLRALSLTECLLSDERSHAGGLLDPLRGLASSRLVSLEQLRVDACALTDADVRTLVSLRLPALRRLELPRNDDGLGTLTGTGALVSASWAPQLECLDLIYSSFDDEGRPRSRPPICRRCGGCTWAVPRFPQRASAA
jgi:hypothetical protein